MNKDGSLGVLEKKDIAALCSPKEITFCALGVVSFSQKVKAAKHAKWFDVSFQLPCYDNIDMQLVEAKSLHTHIVAAASKPMFT